MADAGSVSRPGGRRRRRANVSGGRTGATHKVRVSAEEEAQLVLLAERLQVSVPRLLVESALEERGMTATERQAMATELFGVHRLLGNLANNINQMTKRLHATDEVAPELRPTLKKTLQTCERIGRFLDQWSR